MIVTLKEIEDLGEDRVRDDELPDYKIEKELEDINVNENSENVAEIVGVGSETAGGEEETVSTDEATNEAESTGFQVSDQYYGEAMKGIDWAKYEDHSKYLNMYA